MDTQIDILLVEDNPNDAELTIRELRKHNMANKLVHVEDGALALEFIFGTGKFSERTTMVQPKLVLLDIQMPKVNGIEVLRAIKVDPRSKAIPVVILTSSKEDPRYKNMLCVGGQQLYC